MSDVFAVYDESDTIQFVDRETYLRLTKPPAEEKDHQMKDDVFAVSYESDKIELVDRETYLRLTGAIPDHDTVKRYAAALRAAGYMVMKAEFAKELLRSHQIVTALRAEAQKRTSQQSDAAIPGVAQTPP